MLPLFAADARAQIFVDIRTADWRGTAGATWSTEAHWSPPWDPSRDYSAPLPAQQIIWTRMMFGPAGARGSTNDVTTIRSSISVIEFTASGYTVSGLPIATGVCELSSNFASGTSELSLDIPTTCLFNDGRVLRAEGGGVLIFSGTWPGSPILKVGSGAMRLTRDNSMSDQIEILEGTLQISGSYANAPVMLNGGRLAGTGRVGTVTLNTGGISPGLSAGILTTGSVTFTAGTDLVSELNGEAAGSGYDQLAVVGTTTLSGATLQATFGFSPSTSVATTFTIIANDGVDQIVGTFAGLSEGALLTLGGRSLRVSYVGGDGNDVTLTVLPVPVTLTLSPSSLAGMTAGTATAQTITASPGTAPYTFAVTGGTLPAGLTLSAAGMLSGTPTTAGAYNMTVTATDSLANTGTRAYSGTIGSAVAPITLAPSTLPAMRVGAAFSQTFTASGGTPPYAFAVSGGSLPAGLALATGGALTGTPTTAGAYTVTITVTDSGVVATGSSVATIASTASATYSGTVEPAVATLTLSPSTLPALTVGSVVSVSLAAAGGVGPYTFVVSTGSPPAGLSLSATGLLAGTPTAAGAYNMSITATDANGDTGLHVFTGTIAPAPVPALPLWALLLLSGILLAMSRQRMA